jgi:peptide/nickel transport system permease protein
MSDGNVNGKPVTDLVPEAVEPEIDRAAERKKARRERLRLLYRSPAFVIGALIVAFWIFCGLFPDVLARYDPLNPVRLDDGTILGARLPPSSHAWFGTDQIGRDVYSRTIWGARSVLLTAPAAAILAVIMGTLLGLITGFFRGLVDDVISRIIEGFLSIPVILLALLAATTLGTSRGVIIAVIAVLFTPVVTRTIRSSVIAEAQLDYVTSARLRGEGSFFIMTREIYPNITGTVVVELTVRLGYAIFTVATLAFLGIASGDVTTPDWGVDINQTFVLIQSNQWWPTIFPALAIAALVIAVNLVADTIDRVNKA